MPSIGGLLVLILFLLVSVTGLALADDKKTPVATTVIDSNENKKEGAWFPGAQKEAKAGSTTQQSSPRKSAAASQSKQSSSSTQQKPATKTAATVSPSSRPTTKPPQATPSPSRVFKSRAPTNKASDAAPSAPDARSKVKQQPQQQQQQQQQPKGTASSGQSNSSPRPGRGLRIAFCLTGQLARLELASKIDHIFIANARLGHLSHVFMLLDHDLQNVKQTYWNYDYKHTVFGGYTRRDLKAYIDEASEAAGVLRAVRTRVRLELPSRSKFQVVHGVIPVREKAFTGHDGPKDNFESAWTRFQNNMRWMAGLRDCVRWVMDTEQQQGWHYDLVVRLRDDTYALGDWLLDPSYKGALTSSSSGNFQGINDHNFVIDRVWADTLFRGLTEDYYFNATLEKVLWGNPENRIRTLADSHQIPVRGKNICRQPLIPLRGLVNESYWYVHPLYIRHYKTDCMRLDDKGEVRPGSDKTNYEDEYLAAPKPTCCQREWSQKVHARAVVAYPLPNVRIKGQPGQVGVPKVVKDDVWEEMNNGRRKLLRKI